MDTYEVVVEGYCLPGFKRDAVRRALSQLTRYSLETADRLLMGHAVVVKSGVDMATATRYVETLRAIGVASRAHPETLELDAQLLRRLPAVRDTATPPQQDPSNVPCAVSKPLDGAMESNCAPQVSLRATEGAMPSADTKPTKSSAWARLFARMIDLPIASLIALPFLASVDAASSANFERVLGPAVGGFVKVGLQFAVFSVILISYESILLRMFGTTAGKAILGLRMQVQDARPIDWATAWRRTASAWMRGSWAYFMFPIVTLLVWWRVYMALQKEGVTSWDQRFNTRVLGDPGPMRRTIGGSIAAIGFVTVILLLVVGGQMERNQRKQIARDTFERSRSPTLTKGVTFPSLRSPSTEHQHLTLARQLAGKWFCLAMNFTNEYSREGVIEEYRPNGTQADGQERWYIDGDGRLNEANLFAQNGSNPGYFVWRIEWETPGQRFVKTNVDSGAQLGCERRH